MGGGGGGLNKGFMVIQLCFNFLGLVLSLILFPYPEVIIL